MTMFAFVNPETKAVDPASVSPESGENRFPVVITGEPPYDRKTERPVAGPLYFNEETKTVRRAYVIRALSNQELAEQKGERTLKLLATTDQGMVRSLEEAVVALMKKAGLTFDDISPEAAQRFKDRESLRKSLQ